MNSGPMNTIFQFLINNYELIVYTNLFFLASCIVIYALVKLRMIGIKRLKRIILSGTLIFLQVVGYGLMLYIHFYNISSKEAMDKGIEISVYTQWVKDDIEVYFMKGSLLQTVHVRGGQPRTIYSAESPIREYHFSPNGQKMLIVSQQALVVMNRKDGSVEKIDTIPKPRPNQKTPDRGVIQGVQWAPDSQKFCYRVVAWGGHYYKDNWIIHDLKTGKKSRINDVGYQLSSLKWDVQGENLYYLWFEALDTSDFANPFEVKVIKVPLDTMRPKEVVRFFYDQSTIPPSHLAVRNIYLFEVGHLVFTRQKRPREVAVSSTGARIGVDEEDHLFYVKNQWWKKRLYFVPRIPDTRQAYPDFEVGQLVIQNPRWLPSGRYVIMEHYLFGIVILDPKTEQLGILVNDDCRGVGWPPEALKKRSQR